MASTYLTKTFSGAGNRKTWTMSAWIKRSALASSSDIRVWGWKSGGGNYGFQFDSDKFRFYLVAGGSGSEFLTNRLFRDINAWYHIVAKCDTTQSTASDRFKIYVNGVQETSFSTATYPNLNEDTAVNQAEICRLGCNVVAENSFFDGLMSHVHFTDGYAYDASTFGSTDSTTGEWKINTSPSVTYGTNGFFLLKDDNAVTDRSGQGNNFTLGGGTFTKTEDCPSNVFATINPLNVPTSNAPTFANGNTTSTTPGSSGRFGGTSTLGMSAGKYYWEAKYVISGLPRGGFGVTYDPGEQARNNTTASNTADAWEYQSESGYIRNNNSNLDTEATYANGDIVMCALDLTNNKIYFGKNGTWLNSGDPTSGSTGTGAYSVTADKTYFTITSDNTSGSDQQTYQFNFGNGYFGTTAISSEGTNASGIGKFEYDVPTGYTALSTKGLNE